MTHEESTVLQARFLAGDELTNNDIDSLVAHFMEEPCEVCEASRRSISERKGWCPRSIREFEALIIADAVLHKG